MKNKKPNQTLILIVSILLSLGIGFYGGTKYKPSNKQEFVNQFNQRSRNQMGGNRQILGQTGQKAGGIPGGFRPIVGEIIAIDGKTITIKLGDGSNKIVLISSSTSITTSQPASINNLKIGDKASVFGNFNPDGSTTAQNIQLNIPTPNASPSAIPQK